jgi:hypothetical protein
MPPTTPPFQLITAFITTAIVALKTRPTVKSNGL